MTKLKYGNGRNPFVAIGIGLDKQKLLSVKLLIISNPSV